MSYAALPSALTMTNHVLRECGVPEVASSISSREALVAFDGLNDGTAEAWNRQRWDFQRNEYTFALTGGNAEYPLPPRFQRMATPPRPTPILLGAAFLTEMTPEEWTTANIATSVTNEGTPTAFTVQNTTIALWPTPAAAYVANNPNMTLEYFARIPDRLEPANSSSSLDLPLEFYDFLIRFAKGRLKEYLQYDDAQLNYQQAEHQMQTLVNRWRTSRMPDVIRPRYAPIITW